MWCFPWSLCWNMWFWDATNFLAASYICLCTVRPEEIHRLSAFLRTLFADLSWSLISQYHGSLFCNGALVWVTGACMSIREHRNSFNCSADRFDLVAMYVEISWLKLSLFIELMLSLLIGTLGGFGMDRSRWQVMHKWSEESSWVTEVLLTNMSTFVSCCAYTLYQIKNADVI